MRRIDNLIITDRGTIVAKSRKLFENPKDKPLTMWVNIKFRLFYREYNWLRNRIF